MKNELRGIYFDFVYRDRNAEVMNYLREHGEATVPELVKVFGYHQSNALRVMERLIKARTLTKEKRFTRKGCKRWTWVYRLKEDE